ncbi:MAG: MoaD/ThiS family protein [Bacillota bacterium]
MVVKVRVFGILCNYTPGRAERHELEVAPGTTAGQVLELLGIPWEEVWLLSVDNRQVDESRSLNAGDELLVFPPVAGGRAGNGVTG